MSGNANLTGLIDKAQEAGAIKRIRLEVLPEIKLRDKNSWLSKAQQINSFGDYSQSAIIYFSLYSLEKKEPERKVFYGISLAQELINASNLGEAEDVLKQIEKLSQKTKGILRLRVLSAVFEKKGWIADCRGLPHDEIRYLEKSRRSIAKIPLIQRDKEDQERLLTIEHFIGRAFYKRNRKNFRTDRAIGDLMEARRLFLANLKAYSKIGREDAVAFNNAWLTRVAMAMSDTKEAKKRVALAKKHFERVSEETSSNHILGHYYRIASEFAIFEKKKKEAVEQAIKALGFTIPSGTYFNGTMEAVRLLLKASAINK